MTKWALEITITCADKGREAANALLEQLGWGSNNINVQAKDKSWSTVIPITELMLADVKQLADKHPKLNIVISNRTKASKEAKIKCQSAAKSIFDKSEYKSNASNRTKAKVDMASLTKEK